MSNVVYTFTQGGHERGLLFVRASEALYSAVKDLHEQDAEPVAIT